MITTKFEDTYVCVKNASYATEYVSAVVDVLSKQTAPQTCKEIGLAVFGNDYKDSCKRKSYACRLGKVLKHLREGGFIKIMEIKGEPMEVERMEYVRIDNKGNLPYIKVHDDEGNTYDMPNPKFDHRTCYRGSWQKVKKIVTPTYNAYSWVAE